MEETIFGFEKSRSWDYENGFYLTSSMTRIAKLLAHYELYKSILHLPGHVIECGVFKGASMIRFLTFRNLLESPYSRKIIGFDAFGQFPAQLDAEDQAFIDSFSGSAGDGISRAELSACFEHKELQNYELVEGDVVDTLPRYLEQHPELRVALLHIDLDVYQPSKVALDLLADRVVRGGLIVFDDFGTVAGETRAVDEFLAQSGDQLQKLSLSQIPSFIRKGAGGLG